MVRICKMMISPGGFLNLSKFLFPGRQGCERAKNSPTLQKYLSVAPYI